MKEGPIQTMRVDNDVMHGNIRADNVATYDDKSTSIAAIVLGDAKLGARTAMGIKDTGYSNNPAYSNNDGRAIATTTGVVPQCWALGIVRAKAFQNGDKALGISVSMTRPCMATRQLTTMTSTATM
jgi:hypothetical protein